VINERSTAMLLGDSDAMRVLRERITKIGPARLPVLIEGETGTGKELVAQALHLASGRPGRFVAFNVCAIPESLFESTVFGHVRGAFSGATHSNDGFLAEADGGTAFLDEIATMEAPAQAKMLRALETGEFRPVGARAERRSSFRVIAASNERLSRLVASGRFREDLLQRLSGFVIKLLPLRDRREDIPLLAESFLRSLSLAGSRLSANAMRVLCRHDWPGNVRELKTVIERSVVLATTETISGATVRELLGDTRELIDRVPASGGFSASHERRTLIEMLRRHDGDAIATAETLGVHPSTLYRQMLRLGISSRERLAIRNEKRSPKRRSG
jgi:DNA-binding NtrC family response regulator